jgi:hypothetical protein
MISHLALRGRVLFCLSILCFRSFAADDSPALNFEAKAAPEIDALFQRQDGWIGADGAYSVETSPERKLWLFSDTWMGQIRNGKRERAALINNSVGVQTGPGPSAPVEFITGTNAQGKPEAVIRPDDKRGWFWLNAGIAANRRLYIFLAQIEKTTEPGAFGFRQIGQQLGIVENPGDSPEKWRVRQVPLDCVMFGPERTIVFGAALCRVENTLYIYGVSERKNDGHRKSMVVARVRQDAIEDQRAWEFLGAEGWQSDFRKCEPLVNELASEYSVLFVPALKKFVLVYTRGGLSPQILARTSPNPSGPWSPSTLLYECPDQTSKDVFCYAAKAHPMLSAENELIISYVVNAFSMWKALGDAHIYWPRFIRVKFNK